MADTTGFTLYFSPRSYFSQKVALALFEKGASFSQKVIKLGSNEHCEPWFMRMNPAGKVPVLEDNGKFLAESEDIIDYLDTRFPDAPRLVPDPKTTQGAEVLKWRKLLDVNVYMLTYGTFYNPQLAHEGRKIPIEDLDASMDAKVSLLEKLASENADLKAAYMAKAAPVKGLRVGARDADKFKGVLEDLQSTMDEVEARLMKTAKESTGDLWLLSDEFSVADINLAVLLRRLSWLGIASQFFTPNKRPAVYRYWTKLQGRDSFDKLVHIGED